MKAKKRSRTKKRSLPPFNEHLRYTVPEAAALLKQSPAKTWLDIKEQRLRVIRERSSGTGTSKRKQSGRVYVPGSEIIRLSSVPEQSAPASAAAAA